MGNKIKDSILRIMFKVEIHGGTSGQQLREYINSFSG